MTKRTARRPPATRRAPALTLSVLGRRVLPALERGACLRALRRVTRAAHAGAVDVGVVFVNDFEMRTLNRAWRIADAQIQLRGEQPLLAGARIDVTAALLARSSA